MSPVLWIALLVLLLTRQFAFAILFLVTAVPAQALSVAGMRLTRHIPEFHPQRHVPQFPGQLGGLVRLNIREILSLLDFHAALAFSIAAILYRVLKNHPDSDAYAPMAMMVGLSLSTYTQCCFGLDSGPGLVRYRLLPLCGWQILLAKDAAFLGILCLLAAPTGSGIIAGLTFGLIAVAAGRYPSLALQLPLRKWRFAGGDIRFTLLQFMTAPTLGFAASRDSLWFLALAGVFYLISLFAGGWWWDRKTLPKLP
jgi:hypothetical protein